MITVGCDRESSLEALHVAATFPEVHATVGLHPHEARHGVETIADLFDRSPVAVGECGLDYHYDHSPRDDQRAAFAAQIGVANRLGLPLVIHTREAWEDTFAILDAEGVPARTIFHCFTGGPDEARQCVERGAYVSFSGIVTFPGAPEVREAAAIVPLDRTLVETDSPYLAPDPAPRQAQPPGVGATRRRPARRGPRDPRRGGPRRHARRHDRRLRPLTSSSRVRGDGLAGTTYSGGTTYSTLGFAFGAGGS